MGGHNTRLAPGITCLTASHFQQPLKHLPPIQRAMTYSIRVFLEKVNSNREKALPRYFRFRRTDVG